jgi:hypothetical protein
MKERYNILCGTQIISKNLTEDEYFDKMDELSQEFYDTGTPNPQDLKTEIIGD